MRFFPIRKHRLYVEFIKFYIFGIATAVLYAATAAMAQSAGPSIPKYVWSMDGRIDMFEGGYSFESTELSIGEKGEGGLELTVGYNTLGYANSIQDRPAFPGDRIFPTGTYNWDISAVCNNPCSGDGQTIEIHDGFGMHRFGWVQSPERFPNLYRDGAVFEILSDTVLGPRSIWRLTKKDGTRYFFYNAGPERRSCAIYFDENLQPCLAVSKIEYPDGQTIRFSSFNGSKYISHSRGYAIKIDGISVVPVDPYDVSYFQRIASASIVKLSCYPISTSCLGPAYQTLSYTYSGASPVTSVSSYAGVKSFEYYTSGYNSAYPHIKKITLPGDSSPSYEIGYGGHWVKDALGGQVSRTLTGSTIEYVDRSGQHWPHSFTNSTNYVDGYLIQPNTLAGWSDPLGNATSFEYDQYIRQTGVFQPEGDGIRRVLDARGNATETRKKAKPLSGLPDVVSTASFPTCSATNFRICNKPTYEIDGKGNRTNYNWDPANGKLISEMRGLNGAGTCPVANTCPTTTYQYSAFIGLGGETFYLLTSQIEQIDTSVSATTTFAYDTSKHFVLKEKAVTAGGVTLRTCFGNDGRGKIVSRTAPRADLASCP